VIIDQAQSVPNSRDMNKGRVRVPIDCRVWRMTGCERVDISMPYLYLSHPETLDSHRFPGSGDSRVPYLVQAL